MAFVSSTAKQWLAGHRKGISILHSIMLLITPSLCLCLSSSFLSIPFLPLRSFLYSFLPWLAWVFLCVMGLEALGPFVRVFHLNASEIMVWVGLDAAPMWHSANGVCEDTALSLSFTLSLSPSVISLTDSKWSINIVFFSCAVSSWGLVNQCTTHPKTYLNYSWAQPIVQLLYLLSLSHSLFFSSGKMCHNRPLYWLE